MLQLLPLESMGQAPYLIEEAPPTEPSSIDIDETKKSWTYKKPDGTWEIKEPVIMMDTFFNDIVFKEYDSKDVYVLGFSQGAAACYEYIMGMSKSFGGIFPIGGFFFKDSVKDKRINENNKNTPIIIGHGTKDKVIPIEKSKIAYNQLLKEGANVIFYEYNGGHKISMNYLRKILEIINE